MEGGPERSYQERREAALSRVNAANENPEQKARDEIINRQNVVQREVLKRWRAVKAQQAAERGEPESHVYDLILEWTDFPTKETSWAAAFRLYLQHNPGAIPESLDLREPDPAVIDAAWEGVQAAKAFLEEGPKDEDTPDDSEGTMTVAA